MCYTLSMNIFQHTSVEQMAARLQRGTPKMWKKIIQNLQTNADWHDTFAHMKDNIKKQLFTIFIRVQPTILPDVLEYLIDSQSLNLFDQDWMFRFEHPNQSFPSNQPNALFLHYLRQHRHSERHTVFFQYIYMINTLMDEEVLDGLIDMTLGQPALLYQFLMSDYFYCRQTQYPALPANTSIDFNTPDGRRLLLAFTEEEAHGGEEYFWKLHYELKGNQVDTFSSSTPNLHPESILFL